MIFDQIIGHPIVFIYKIYTSSTKVNIKSREFIYKTGKNVLKMV